MTSHGYDFFMYFIFIFDLSLYLSFYFTCNFFLSLQSWIYDRKHNKGKLANYHAHKQRTSGCPRLRADRKGAQTKSKEEEPLAMYSHISDLNLSNDVSLDYLSEETSLNLKKGVTSFCMYYFLAGYVPKASHAR